MQNVRCLPRLPKDLQFPTDPDRITGGGLHFHGWVIKPAVFSFLYFLKIKISKIYVRFEIFQKYPRSPPIGRQGLSVIFFLQIRNEVPEKKGPVAPPTGDRPYIGRHMPPFPLSFEPKNSGKKRGVRRRKTAKLCRIAYFLKWWKGTAIGSRMSGQRMPHLGNP